MIDSEIIVKECTGSHEWIGQPLYCSACGVDKGNEIMTGAEVEEALSLDKMLDVVMAALGMVAPDTILCPEGDGGYDCTPFCPSCEGNQEIKVNA